MLASRELNRFLTLNLENSAKNATVGKECKPFKRIHKTAHLEFIISATGSLPLLYFVDHADRIPSEDFPGKLQEDNLPLLGYSPQAGWFTKINI